MYCARINVYGLVEMQHKHSWTVQYTKYSVSGSKLKSNRDAQGRKLEEEVKKLLSSYGHARTMTHCLTIPPPLNYRRHAWTHGCMRLICSILSRNCAWATGGFSSRRPPFGMQHYVIGGRLAGFGGSADG
jgi:hypothetical protein